MAKSVIEIEVDDKAFKAFAEAFKKFQKAIDDATKGVETLGDKADKATSSSTKNVDKFNRGVKDLNKNTRDSAAGFDRLAKSSASIAKSFGEAAFSAGKWMSFGALGGFGLQSIISNALDVRKQGLGTGTNPAKIKSAVVAFDRLLDVDALLGRIADAKKDPTKFPAFSALGIKGDPGAIDSGDLVARAIAGLPAYYARSTVQQRKDEGVTGLIGSEQEMQRIASTPAAERDALIESYRKGIKSLAISDRDLKELQDLKTKAEMIGNTALIAWARIFGSIARAAQGSSTLGKAWDALGVPGDWLINKAVSGIVGSPMEATGKLPADWVSSGKGAAFMGRGSLPSALNGGASPKLGYLKDKSSKLAYLAQLDKANGLPPGTLASIWQQESSQGANKGYSKAGALGDFQFMSGTAARHGLSPADRTDFYKSSQAAGEELRDLLTRFNGNLEKAIAGYNVNANKISMTDPNWKASLPAETQAYVPGVMSRIPGVNITIYNAPGTSVATSVAAATGQ